jgi:hypothetical protein
MGAEHAPDSLIVTASAVLQYDCGDEEDSVDSTHPYFGGGGRIKMELLATNWEAVGSVATGIAAVAAFAGLLPAFIVYHRQDRRDRATIIRQRIQFIAAQQRQVLISIQVAFPTIIDRQISEFRHSLGTSATSADFLDAIFNNNALFLTSAMDSCLSSVAYSRMNDLWNQINQKASEFRGAFRIFSYACYLLTLEPYRVCSAGFSQNIIASMKANKVPETLEDSDNLDALTNKLRTMQVRVATQIFLARSRDQIQQASLFVSQLAEATLNLEDISLLKLSRKRIVSPSSDQNLLDKIGESIQDLVPELPDAALVQLRETLKEWRHVSTREYAQHALGKQQKRDGAAGGQGADQPPGEDLTRAGEGSAENDAVVKSAD